MSPDCPSFNPTNGNFSWTPDAGDVANSPFTVTFIATDSANQTDEEEIEITVSAAGGGVDNPPVLAAIGNRTVSEGAMLMFMVSATDDLDIPTLSVMNSPTGATFDAGTGIFSWIPGVGTSASSPFTLTFIATDSQNQTDQEMVDIIVTPVSAAAFQQSDGPMNLLVMEAENAQGNIPRLGDMFEVPNNPVQGFSGVSALQALEDDGDRHFTNFANAAPQLVYEANFVTAGIHYVHVLGHGPRASSDSVHVGLDGAEVSTSTNVGIPRTAGYEWSDGADTINVTSPGLHTIDVWAREDGVYVDKILLTTDANFDPTGTGPAESGRVSDCTVFPSVRIDSPEALSLQTSNDLEVTTFTCLDPVLQAGWGIVVRLDGGLAGGGEEITLTSAPFNTTFTNVSQAEHSVEVVVIDETGAEQAGPDVVAQVSQVGVGDYYVAVGDSITFGTGDDITSDDQSADQRNSSRGYTPILNDLLTAGKNYPHTVINAGVPGETAEDGASRIAAVIASNPLANFYLLKFGMNDSQPGNPVPSGLGLNPGDPGYANSYKAQMVQIIDQIQLTNFHC